VVWGGRDLIRTTPDLVRDPLPEAAISFQWMNRSLAALAEEASPLSWDRLRCGFVNSF
jgi:hypothetical protein